MTNNKSFLWGVWFFCIAIYLVILGTAFQRPSVQMAFSNLLILHSSLHFRVQGLLLLAFIFLVPWFRNKFVSTVLLSVSSFMAFELLLKVLLTYAFNFNFLGFSLAMQGISILSATAFLAFSTLVSRRIPGMFSFFGSFLGGGLSLILHTYYFLLHTGS